jgi:hypothetical protein
VRRTLTREELFAGNRESVRMAFFSRDSILWWVITTFHRRRNQYRRLFDSRTLTELAYIEFRTPFEAEIFLALLQKNSDPAMPSIPNKVDRIQSQHK